MLNKLFGNKKSQRQFKTNINCGKCIMAVSPHLEAVHGLSSWDVDLNDPERKMTVKGDVNEQELAKALSEAGYALGEEVR